MEEALYSHLLSKLGGLVLATVTKLSIYVFFSNQAGQLSNLHSLATTNRKPAIFVLISISGIIKLQTNSYSFKKKQVVHTKLCQHDAKTLKMLNCERLVNSLNDVEIVVY